MLEIPDNVVLELNGAQKRALFKLAVDIVKADKCIHSNEVSFLDSMQKACGIQGSELELIHYLSLQQAVKALKSVDARRRRVIAGVLESIVGVDNDIDERENMLLAAVKMALGEESAAWSTVISAAGNEAECTSRQIVYLEKEHCPEAHAVLGDPYDNLLLTKALDDVGLQLFYLPSVVEELGRHWDSIGTADTKLQLLCRSMEFIVPAGDRARLAGLSGVLKGIDSATFYKVVCSRCCIDVADVPYEAFMMIKVQDGYVLDDDGNIVKSSDFLCIDISCELKRRMLHFVGLLEAPACLLSYEGYYRILYDYLSSESAIMSDVVIDAKYDFCLKQLDSMKLRFESAPQAKTFYLLLLRYGRSGISQACFEKALAYIENGADGLLQDGAFDIMHCKSVLAAMGEDWALLVYNIITIYECLSTKDSASIGFLGYVANIIRHRSSLKNYINKAFMSVRHLAGKESYCVRFEPMGRVYSLAIDNAFFYMSSPLSGDTVRISVSELWKRLKVN